MKACGIITEYNPFHYGHEYHIAKTKELTSCDVIINVMSGHFVQRGEAAIADKWIRARTAIEQGCDLVIELPYAYALQSASGFAQGAVRSLQLAQVQDIVFGSESNDIRQLQIHSKLALSNSKSSSPAASLSVSSNDILGISYVREIAKTSIIPHTIQRTNTYHDTHLDQRIVSATAIRKAIYEGKDVTFYTPMANLLTTEFAMEQYYPYVQYLLLTMEEKLLADLFLMDEGIEHLMIRQAKLCHSMKEFIDNCISKRYTRAKIQRTIIHLLTQTKKTDIDSLPTLSHIRLLAMKQNGRAYVKELKHSTVVIASRFNQIPKPYRDMELRVTSAYAAPLSIEKRLALLKQELQPVMVI